MKTLKYSRLSMFLTFAVTTFSSNAVEILFAHVDDDGSYKPNGIQLAEMIDALSGFNVTTRYLDAEIYTDYDSFDQVWVYDLYRGADREANQLANYTNIANWYNNLSYQNLILDGRIISSTTGWASTPESSWIQNYAKQMDLLGGGLVLGTDHAPAFTDGINEINAQIDIEPFTGFIYEYPYEALVDENSPLHLESLTDCSSSEGGKCINDSSSTSIVPTGLQGNGQTLTPVAFHGSTSGAWENAAVASTMGSRTFETCGLEGQQPCTVPEPPVLALYGLGIAAFGWLRHRKPK